MTPVPMCRNIRFICPFAAPAKQNPDTDLYRRPVQEVDCTSHQKEDSLLHPRCAPRDISLHVTPEPAPQTLESRVRSVPPTLLGLEGVGGDGTC